MEDHEFYCKIDEDGRCLECLKRLSTAVRTLAQVLAENHKRLRAAMEPVEDWCDICGNKNADAVFCAVLKEAFGDLGPDLRKNVYLAFRPWAIARFCLSAMPLCDHEFLSGD